MNLDKPNFQTPNYVKAIVGIIAGGVLGYIGFYLLLQLGLYAMILPGAMIGLGCGAQAGARSLVLGVVAGIVAFAFGVFIEWNFFPFVADGSFGFFVKHLSDLTDRAQLMIAAGTFAGFWFGRGR